MPLPMPPFMPQPGIPLPIPPFMPQPFMPPCMPQPFMSPCMQQPFMPPFMQQPFMSPCMQQPPLPMPPFMPQPGMPAAACPCRRPPCMAQPPASPARPSCSPELVFVGLVGRQRQERGHRHHEHGCDGHGLPVILPHGLPPLGAGARTVAYVRRPGWCNGYLSQRASRCLDDEAALAPEREANRGRIMVAGPVPAAQARTRASRPFLRVSPRSRRAPLTPPGHPPDEGLRFGPGHGILMRSAARRVRR